MPYSTSEQLHAEYEARRKYEEQQKRWNDIRQLLGAKHCHTLAEALRVAAEQYRKDMEATHQEETARVSSQFHKQAKDCEALYERFEL